MSRNKSAKMQNVKAVILAGSRDFGQCQLASRLPTALWPIADKPILEQLLKHLSSQGIKQVTLHYKSDVSRKLYVHGTT